MILGHIKNEKWNRPHFRETLTRDETIQTGVLFMRDHVPCEQLVRAAWFRPLFLNLFGSKSRLKASFETTVPVKEIRVPVVEKYCFRPLRHVMNYKLNRKSLLQQLNPETLCRSNNTWDFLNERKVSNTICELIILLKQ